MISLESKARMYGEKKKLPEKDVEELLKYCRENQRKIDKGMVVVKGGIYRLRGKTLTEDDINLFDEWYKKIKENEMKREEDVAEEELLRLLF